MTHDKKPVQFVEDDYVTPVIFDIASRYGITVDWAAYDPGRDAYRTGHKKYADFCWGPQGDAGISIKGRYLYAYDSDTEVVFHELVHLILGREGLKLCEGYLLMPYEWELAKWAAKRMEKDADWFLRGVRQYQEVTDIQLERETKSNSGIGSLEPEHRRTRWWHNGVRRAQALGLLDARKQPTFKRPVWRGSGVKRALSWSADTDRRWVP